MFSMQKCRTSVLLLSVLLLVISSSFLFTTMSDTGEQLLSCIYSAVMSGAVLFINFVFFIRFKKNRIYPTCLSFFALIILFWSLMSFLHLRNLQ